MKGSKRVFVAAWEYPPIMSGESVVCRKTLEHSTFDYDVCCGPIDTQGNGHVRFFPIGGNKYLKWPFSVARKFRELDQQEHYSVMMSRVMPPNGHLAGWLIKRHKPGLKWVVYFSDPICNSPFLKFSLRRDNSHRPNWLLMKIFGIPAKWAIRESDLLVFNNERLARYVLGRKYEKYRSKVVITSYGHEGVKPRPAPNRHDGKVRLTHVGQIYGSRTFKALLNGVELLKEREPKLFERLDIRQVGFVCEEERKRVESAPAAAAFTFVGQVPYESSIEEMYQADCLLVIDPVFDDPRKNIYVPGKIFDYMSTGRAILCIADSDSATGDIAKEMNFKVSPQFPEAVCAALKEFLIAPNATDPIKNVERYHCQIGVNTLDATIEKLLKEQGYE